MHEEAITPGSLTESARSVLEALMIAGPLSRAELSRRLSLSAASLTKITRPLLSAQYFIELEEDAPSTGGRPPRPLDINADFAHFVGVKLTGDTVFAVTTDARGQVKEKAQESLSGTDPESVAAQVAVHVARFCADDPRIVGVGIALSGNAMRTSPVVRTSPFLHWHDVPLGDMVAARTGLPVVLENDVRAVTAAEHWFGAAASYDSFVLLTLGAGIGCGIVVNGTQVEGHLGASGLVGHLRIAEAGPLCYAGHAGCAHAYATTSAIANRVSMARGSRLDFDECLELFDRGDPAAVEAFSAAGRAIGSILATVVNLIGPEKIFVSGEGVGIYQAGQEAARERLRELLHWTASEVDIESQPFGFTEWARGAAVVAIQSWVRQSSAKREPLGRARAAAAIGSVVA